MTDERLTIDERIFLRACIDVYVAGIRTACAKDQGDPDGRPGTIGHEAQVKAAACKEKLRLW